MTMILCLVHLIVGTPQMNQKPQDRKERQLGLLALGLGELFGSIFAGSAAAAAGTAALATGAAGAGLLGAAAIKDAVDHHHSGSSGSSGGSSGGSQTTSVADQTISRVQTMSKAQVETEIRTLVTTAGAPRPSSKYSCKDNVVIFLFLISILAKLILSKTEVVFNHLIKCLLTFCSCYITTQDVQMVMFVIIVEKKKETKNVHYCMLFAAMSCKRIKSLGC